MIQLIIENFRAAGASTSSVDGLTWTRFTRDTRASTQAVLWCQDNLPANRWQDLTQGSGTCILEFVDEQDLASLLLSVDFGSNRYRIKRYEHAPPATDGFWFGEK